VLVSDYGNGMARVPALRDALPPPGTTPLVWDPHPRGPEPVPGARLITPNEAELRGLVSTPDGPRLSTLALGAAALRERWRAGSVAVTLGADGALLCHAGPTPLVVPPPIRANGDTCGAGDGFAAAAAGALAGGALVSEAVQEAVVRASAYVAGAGAMAHSTAGVPRAAGVLVRGGGGTRPSPAADAASVVRAVRARGGTVVASGGCFDLLHAGHVGTLQAARGLGDCLVVCLNSDTSVRGLKGTGRPVVPQADRASLLEALGCVDAVIVFDEPTPHAVLAALRPDVWVKGGDYLDGATDQPALPEAELVRQWGGQAVVVPYLAGRSTTRIIAAARAERRRSDGRSHPPE
jgi:rfaE bifunctional protein nucleotidyltransferase chain/domain